MPLVCFLNLKFAPSQSPSAGELQIQHTSHEASLRGSCPAVTRQAIRIGTRASRLAQAQSAMMQARIALALGGPAEEVAPLVLCTTSGDRIQDRRLLEAGGKALFTKELE